MIKLQPFSPQETFEIALTRDGKEGVNRILSEQDLLMDYGEEIAEGIMLILEMETPLYYN